MSYYKITINFTFLFTTNMTFFFFFLRNQTRKSGWALLKPKNQDTSAIIAGFIETKKSGHISHNQMGYD